LTPSRIVHWAQTIGPHTAQLFEGILSDKPHPEMGYRSCLGITRLANRTHRLAWKPPRSGTPYGSVPLPECQVDPEELA
jgi:hypothetical protein